ncbi:MAG: PEP-CTERM system TPR-repeat protein PrsT [Thiobacillus sp.]|nr:PEP-CTERM system TPR-repeat protein PrsT [Thiobacillus sp.]
MNFPSLLMFLLASIFLAPLAHADSAVDASRYYEDALKRYERNDDAGAIIQLKNALKADSRMLPALVLMGQAYLREGDPAAAERVLVDAEKLGAARGQIATLQAQAYLAQGKARLMLEKFGADGLPPQARLEMLLMRGQAQLKLNQLDAAMTSARQVAQIAGGSARALALQARIHLNAGRPQDAQAVVQEALRVSPRNADVLNMQASVFHVRGDLQTAVREYGRALESEPNHLDARLARAGALLDLQRDSEVKTDLDYLQKHFAYDPRGAYLRALYFSRQGDEVRSRVALHEATRTLSQLPPEFLSASDQLQLLGGLAHHALGEFERAKSFLTPYQDRHPRDVGVRKLLASIYLAERQYDRVITLLQPALREQPDDARVLAMLGEVAMRRGMYDKAASLFKEAAEAHDSPDIQAGLGVSLISAGQMEAGFQTLTRAFAKTPDSTQAAIPYALALLKRGDARKAVAVVETLIKREPGNVAMLNLLGITRLASGDRAGARTAYVAAIKASPSFYPAHLNLARIDEIDKLPERARKRYLGILKVSPAHIDTMLELARLEESISRPDEALRWLEKARNTRSKDLRTHLALSAFYLKKGQPKPALDAAKEAQAQSPDDPRTLLALAQSQIAGGHGDAARAVLRRLVQVAAFNPARLTQTAALQMQIGDPEAARYTLSKALLADPGYSPARSQQVRLVLKSGNISEAEKQAQALLNQSGMGAEAQRLMGEIHMAQKRYPEAVAAYRKAHAKAPVESSVFGLFDALMASGQASEAAALMSRWRDSHPQSRLATHALGEAWLAMKDAPRARTVYAGLVRTDPKDARAHNNLAQVLLQLGDAAALTHAEQARALAPNQPQVNDTLGWVLVQQGQLEKGLRYLREAALRAPEDKEIQSHLNETLARLKRH